MDDIPSFLLRRNPLPTAASFNGCRASISLAERGLLVFSRLLKNLFTQWALASRSGLLQSLDARIKIVCWILLLLLISWKTAVSSLCMITVLIAVLVIIANVRLIDVYGKVIPFALFFGVLLSAPSLFNVFVPGKVIYPLLTLSAPMTVLNFPIPQSIGVTEEGINVFLRLTLRVFSSLSLSLFMLSITPFSDVLRALKLFFLPDTVILLIALTEKYVYLFAQMVLDMYRAVNVRLVSGISSAEFRFWSAGRMAFIFRKACMRADDIYRAMICRGFAGDICLYQERKCSMRDIPGAFILAVFVLLAVLM
jgi:cobalt/nickel transport system permease protein